MLCKSGCFSFVSLVSNVQHKLFTHQKVLYGILLVSQLTLQLVSFRNVDAAAGKHPLALGPTSTLLTACLSISLWWKVMLRDLRTCVSLACLVFVQASV